MLIIVHIVENSIYANFKKQDRAASRKSNCHTKKSSRLSAEFSAVCFAAKWLFIIHQGQYQMYLKEVSTHFYFFLEQRKSLCTKQNIFLALSTPNA